MHNFDIKCIIYISDKSQLYLLFTRIIGDEGAGQREGRERKQHNAEKGMKKMLSINYIGRNNIAAPIKYVSRRMCLLIAYRSVCNGIINGAGY